LIQCMECSSQEREAYETEVASFDGSIVFEQDPNQILDALLPLYMNSQVLRAFQVSGFSMVKRTYAWTALPHTKPDASGFCLGAAAA
jgi:F0F1-type ATP synthase gamma subunit